MAITILGQVAAGNGSTSSATLTVTFTAATQPGDALALLVASDNTSGTTSPIINSITDAKSTWTARANAGRNATAAAGIRGNFWSAKVNTAHQIGDTITVTLSAAVVAKAAWIFAARGADADTPVAVPASTNNSTASPTRAHTPAAAGNLVLCCAAMERNGTGINGDTDTTAGSWSSLMNVEAGGGLTGATSVCALGQAKIVTATTAQSWTATASTGSDWVAFSIEWSPAPVDITWPGPTTGGTGGALTDTPFNTFIGSGGIQSTYQLYASGLDWNKPVGILIYTDGSGEFGLENPDSAYLLAGASGMIAVAKRHNMILLTPQAPGDGCTDNGGVCWYRESFDGTTRQQKITWSKELIDYIYSQYDIDLDRVFIGGYSSGAQWTTQYFGPLHAAKIMADGLAMAISYGGEPIDTPAYTTDFKQNVPFVWDVGDLDPSYTAATYGVIDGEEWYRTNGFTTQLHVVPGLDHNRADFGAIVNREIIEHVIPAEEIPPSGPVGDIGTPRIGALVVGGTGSTTTAVPYPSGVTEGEFLLIGVGARSSGAFTATGWTPLQAMSATTVGFTFLYKIAEASDVGQASVTVTGPAALRSLKMMAVPGVDPDNPIDGLPTSHVAATVQATASMPSQTPTVEGCMPVWGSTGFLGTGVTWTTAQSSGTTEWLDTWVERASGDGWSTGLYWQTPLADNSATGVRTVTPTASATLAGMFILLRPAPLPATTPSAPLSLSATPGNGKVSLTWSAPADDGGAAITDYVVQYKASSSGTWLTFNDGTSTNLSAEVTGLTNDTQYDFRVAAVNSVGTGTYSSTVSSTPIGVSGDNLNILLVGNGSSPGTPDTAIRTVLQDLGHTVTFANAAGSVPSLTGYDVMVMSASMSSGQANTWIAQDIPTLNLEAYSFDAVTQPVTNADPSASWPNNTGDDIQIINATHPITNGYALNDIDNLGLISLATIPTTAYAAGIDILAVHPSNTSHVVLWAANQGATLHTGTAISRLVGIAGDYSSSENITLYASFSVLMDKALRWLVNASAGPKTINASGIGSTASVGAPVVDAPAVAPSAPLNLTSTQGNTRVFLNWDAPSSNGGASITDYVVEYKESSGSTWTVFSDGTSTSLAATVTGLTNGTSYDFRVAAVNSAGTGAYSNTTTATPQAPTGNALNLLLVGNGNSPGNPDIALTNLLQDLGHSVTFTNAAGSIPSLVAYDAMIISASMTSSQADAWVAQDIPTLNFEGYSFNAVTQPVTNADPSATWSNSTGDDIQVADAAHPVMSGFASSSIHNLGIISLATIPTSAYASGVDILAVHPSNTNHVVVWAVDEGASLHTGTAISKLVGIAGDYSSSESIIPYAALGTLVGNALQWLAGPPPTQTITASSISLTPTIGTPTRTVGGVSRSVTGIASTTAIGSVSLSGRRTINTAGIASTALVGTPGIQTQVSRSVSGISGSASVGSPSLWLAPFNVTPPVLPPGPPAVGAAFTATTGYWEHETTIEYQWEERSPVGPITPSGFLSGTSIGASGLAPGGVSTSPGTISSWLSIGILSLVPGAVTRSIQGVSLTSALGTPAVQPGKVTISPAGIASTASVGSPTRSVGPVTLNTAGIASTSSIGSSAAIPVLVVVFPSGLSSSATVGAPTLFSGTATVPVSALVNLSRAGSVTLVLTYSLPATAISSTATIGIPGFQTAVTVSPGSVENQTSVGTPTLWLEPYNVKPPEIPQGHPVEGVPLISYVGEWAYTTDLDFQWEYELVVDVISPSGVQSTSSIGTVSFILGSVSRSLSGIAPTSTVGSVSVTPGPATVSPLQISSTLNMGTATVVPGPRLIAPTSINSTSSIGMPQLSPGPVIITPGGIAVVVSMGTPNLLPGAVSRSIQSVASSNLFGQSAFILGGVSRSVSSITSGTAISTPALIPGTATATPTSIVGTTTLGSVVLTVGGVTLNVPSIESASHVGTPTPSSGVVVNPPSVELVNSFGTPIISSDLQIISVASVNSTSSIGAVSFNLEASLHPAEFSNQTSVGSPTLQPGTLTRAISGVASTSAVGTPDLGAGIVIDEFQGIASSESVGSVVISTQIGLTATSIDNQISIGAPSVRASNSITVSSVESFTSVGSAELQSYSYFSVGAIGSSATVPTPQLDYSYTIPLEGLPSQESFGDLELTSTAIIEPESVAAQPIIPLPEVNATYAIEDLQGIQSETAEVGAPDVIWSPGPDQTITPAGINSVAKTGALELRARATIQVAGIASVNKIGVLQPYTQSIGPSTILASGADSEPTFGIPVITVGPPPPAQTISVVALEATSSVGSVAVILHVEGETLAVAVYRDGQFRSSEVFIYRQGAWRQVDLSVVNTS